VKSVEILKSSRPVRALLLKGARREVKDNSGKTPLDLVGDHIPENLRRDLEAILVITLGIITEFIG
jgi:hypothetical protein